jgi:hypothetical protein
MAFEHVSLPVFGLQFHPESILTESGYELFANFLRLSGLPCAAETIGLAKSERPVAIAVQRALPSRPVTF